MTMRWISTLRQLVQTKVKNVIKSGRLQVKYRSPSINIYHCCVQKTGSQWIKAILSDSRTYRWSGLTPYRYQNILYHSQNTELDSSDLIKATHKTLTAPFPGGTIVSPLYADFENYMAIPKPETYKAFFVMRDPRDIVVSWYFSVRYSHSPIGKIPKHREELNRISITDGLLYSIEYLHDFGLFAALKSWIDAPGRDPNVLLLRFEDLIPLDNFEVLKKLFSHCDIRMPEEVLHQLLRDYSFERLSGRQRGEEDKRTHYRKGVPGDWKNYFDDKITAEFKNFTGDLVTRAGYENNLNW